MDEPKNNEDAQSPEKASPKAPTVTAGGPGESRGFPREPATYAINLMVALHGFDVDQHRFEAKGTTINMSCSGLLCRVNRPVGVESRCLVHLPDGEEYVGRTMIYGVIRRVAEVDDGFDVGVEFDSPLDFLKAPDDAEAT